MKKNVITHGGGVRFFPPLRPPDLFSGVKSHASPRFARRNIPILINCALVDTNYQITNCHRLIDVTIALTSKK